MNDFLGFLPALAGTRFALGLTNFSTGLPATPDANPVCRIYGQEGLVNTGDLTLAPFESGTIVGATNAAPIVVTFGAPTTLSSGTAIFITGVGGNTNANGRHVVTVLTPTTARLNVNGNAAYTAGGLWMTAGLYLLDLTIAAEPSLVAALEAGQNYTADCTWTEGGGIHKQTFGFIVN